MNEYQVHPESSSLPPISIVIPNYNGVRLLRENLPVVLAALNAYPGKGEVLVVDDGSQDDSVALMRESFPEVTCVVHEVNKGFSEAMLTGVVSAKNEVLILLNSDVAPRQDFAEPLIRAVLNQDVFAVQPVIKDENGHVNPYSIFLFKFGWGRLRRVPADHYLERDRCYCVYASGGSMAVMKSRFLALGGFHPVYKPFYWEDFDLCFRAWRRGWKSMVVMSSVVVHQDQGSIRDHYKRKTIRNALNRNKLVMEWVHFPVSTLVTTAIPRVAGRLLGRLLVGDVSYFSVLSQAIVRWPEIRKLRAELKETSVMGFKDVIRLVDSENQAMASKEQGTSHVH